MDGVFFMTFGPRKLFIFSGSANPTLAEKIADFLNIPLGEVEVKRFPDGEIMVQYRQNIRGGDVFIVQPTCYPPNENIMELLIMLDAAKRASAGRITAVIPYFGYARQDRKDRPRVPITAKLVANLITAAGASRICAMDLHSEQIMGFFDIPVDHLHAAPVLVPYIKRRILGSDAVVVAPDTGSVKRAHAFCDYLGCGLAVVAKRRISAVSVDANLLVGDVAGKVCVMTDDLTTTASTLVAAAKLLREGGAKSVIAAVSHCLLTDEGAIKLRNSAIEELLTTDAVPLKDDSGGRIKIFTVAPLFGEAIRRIHEGGSLTTLFDIEIEGIIQGKLF